MIHSRATRGALVILVLAAFGVISTWVMDGCGCDPEWAGGFYSAEGADTGWIYAHDQPWAFLYRYGEIPGIATALGALALLVSVKLGKADRKYVKPCMVVILTVLLGPGLLVNGVLKNSWGRPRPADVSNFGGAHEYRKVWEPGNPGEGKSFPCGHCSIAFVVGSGIAFYPYHPVFGVSALLVGLGYGTIMGWARIAQGGHFPSDVLWAGVIVFSLIAGLYYVVFRIPESTGSTDQHSPGP